MKNQLARRKSGPGTGNSELCNRNVSFTKGHRHWLLARFAEALSLTVLGLACSLQAVAQPAQIGASASVNGRTIFTVNNAAVPNATGSAVAASKIFHPAAGAAGTDFQVNGAAANARTEAPILNALANESQTARAPNPLNYANRAAYQEALVNQGSYINGGQIKLNGQVIANVPGVKNQIAGCTLPDAVAGNPSCTTTAGTGSFPLVAKGGGISSTTSVQRVVAGNNYEFASATASQTTLANGRFRVVDNPATDLRAANGLPAPTASAFTSNHDPMAVYWGSSMNHNITIDLSSFQMSLSTQGSPSGAMGYYGIHGGVINGTNDITLPESNATPFFDLLLGFNSVNGGAPQLNASAFQLASIGSISDSLGNVGLGAVSAGLLGDLTVNGDTVSFALPYSLTVGVPGNQLQDVLFLNSQALTETEAGTPEPSALLLLGSGLVGLGGLMRKRIRG